MPGSVPGAKRLATVIRRALMLSVTPSVLMKGSEITQPFYGLKDGSPFSWFKLTTKDGKQYEVSVTEKG